MEEITPTSIKKDCEKFLNDNKIVYKKNVSVKLNGNESVSFTFVIPGAVINIVSHIMHKAKKIVSKLEKQLKVLPQNSLIYVFIKEIYDYHEDEYLLDSRIKLISNFDQIKLQRPEYWILAPIILASFASLDNDNYEKLVEKYKGVTINTPQTIYDRAVVICNDEELMRLDKFNIIVNNDKSNSMIVIHPNHIIMLNYFPFTFDETFATFNVWIEISKIFNLQSSVPKYIIKGITEPCEQCKVVSFVELLNNNKCIKCIGGISFVPISKTKRTKILNKQIDKQTVNVNMGQIII